MSTSLILPKISFRIPKLTYVSYAGHRPALIIHRNPLATKAPIAWVHGLTGSARFWKAAM
ncbi:hypothetical protein [Neolewinella antarctica]|uniref:Alpha/beta hydrolase n=1 Tax=Neolewinella antarctica TaxID=442734 RepID=A0ABX0XB08_9BACT|nr:hypothetical protein [Neolewinella antarctica]NJC26392.1 hypothetical protein [Neolewinella antarctica]